MHIAFQCKTNFPTPQSCQFINFTWPLLGTGQCRTLVHPFSSDSFSQCPESWSFFSHGAAGSWKYNEPWHDKTNKVSVRPAKTQISLGICPVWSVFTVRLMGSSGPQLSSCWQQRLWSEWVDAQADLSIRWAHSHFVGLVMSWLQCIIANFLWIVMYCNNPKYSDRQVCANSADPDQPDLDLYCLPLCLRVLDTYVYGKTTLFQTKDSNNF